MKPKPEPQEVNDAFARGLALIDEGLRLVQPDWQHVSIWRWKDRYDIDVSHEKPDKSRPKYLWRSRSWAYPRRGFRRKYLPSGM